MTDIITGLLFQSISVHFRRRASPSRKAALDAAAVGYDHLLNLYGNGIMAYVEIPKALYRAQGGMGHFP